MSQANNVQNIAANGKSYEHLLPGLRIGGNRGICTNCAEGFTANSGFDRHQSVNKAGDVVCKHPSKLGMVQGPDGYWGFPPPK